MRLKICCVFILLIVAGLIYWDLFVKALDQISKGAMRRAVRIVDKENKEINLDAFIENYGKRKYYADKSGRRNTAKRTWRFLGEDGEEMFSFTDLGNRALVIVTFGDKEVVYRSFKKKAEHVKCAQPFDCTRTARNKGFASIRKTPRFTRGTFFVAFVKRFQK